MRQQVRFQTSKNWMNIAKQYSSKETATITLKKKTFAESLNISFFVRELDNTP